MQTTPDLVPPVKPLAPVQALPLGAKSRIPVRLRKVTDAATRMFHWLFAFCFLGAYVTADSESFRLVHVTLGYTMAGLLVFRIIWGLIGPKQVRLSAMFRKLTGASAWFRALTAVRSPQALWSLNWKQGQNILMGLAVVSLLLLVIPVTLTGYATYNEWGFRWLQKIHESVGEVYLYMVIVHLALIAMLSVLRQKNQAMPMITGKTTGIGPDLVQRDYVWVAVLLGVAVLVWWGWSVFMG